MHRILAMIERDLRRFRRSPSSSCLISVFMPLVQLVVLGYAFGGKVKHLNLGVLDQDQGLSAIKIQSMCQAVAANAQTFTPVVYHDQGANSARLARTTSAACWKSRRSSRAKFSGATARKSRWSRTISTNLPRPAPRRRAWNQLLHGIQHAERRTPRH